MDNLSDLDRELELAEIRSRLSALSDDTLLSEELACVYLNISPKQLKNLRVADGPEFFKPITEGAEKANMKASYDLGTLRRWKKEHTFKDNRDVAKRVGIHRWVAEPQPFFVLDEHRGKFSILAPADDISRDDWGDRLATAIEGGDINVEWMIPADAAASQWKDLEEHRAFANEYLSAISYERQRVESALTATELGFLI